MWSGLERILEHVTSYSTNSGKIWYLLVFIFRLIVVVTVGQSVYSDEQSAFRCSTKVIGCDNVCYDQFSKISHIRFWAFQLLVVTAPSVLFHFYCLNVHSRIEKIKHSENEVIDSKFNEGSDNIFGSKETNTTDGVKSRKTMWKEEKRLHRRRKSVGKVKFKKIFANNNLVTVTFTRSIRIAYLINVFLRIALEATSLLAAYKLFHIKDYTSQETYNPIYLILIKVPQVYRCEGVNVRWACGQHLNLGERSGYVPCWVSRPFEKTIFMCYMNILSFICCLLSIMEFIQLLHRYSYNRCRRCRESGQTEQDGFGRRRYASNHSQFSKTHSVMEDNRKSETPGKGVVDFDERGKVYTGIEYESVAVPTRTPKRNYKKPAANGPQKRPDRQDLKTRVPVLIRLPQKARRNIKPTRKEYKRVSHKPKTDKMHSVGIRLQEHEDEYSVESISHSDEYESTEDEEESLESVSVVTAFE